MDPGSTSSRHSRLVQTAGIEPDMLTLRIRQRI
jgi:hypothetical protein